MELDVALAKPASPLHSMVEGYRGSRLSGLTPGSHLGLPSPWLTMIVSFGTPTDVSQMPNRSRSPRSFGGFVSGLQDCSAVVSFGSEIACVSTKIHPLHARTFLGCPASAITNEVVDTGDLSGSSGAQLSEQMNGVDDWSCRFAVLDHMLIGSVADAALPPRLEVAWAWHHLAKTRGAVSVAHMASEVGWSRRHFTSQFTKEFGLTPRTAKRLFRFDALVRLLGRRPDISLAQAASLCGYVDQAHMTTDFASFTNTTPGAWLATEFPKSQDSSTRTDEDGFEPSGRLAVSRTENV